MASHNIPQEHQLVDFSQKSLLGMCTPQIDVIIYAVYNLVLLWAAFLTPSPQSLPLPLPSTLPSGSKFMVCPMENAYKGESLLTSLTRPRTTASSPGENTAPAS